MYLRSLLHTTLVLEVKYKFHTTNLWPWEFTGDIGYLYYEDENNASNETYYSFLKLKFSQDQSENWSSMASTSPDWNVKWQLVLRILMIIENLLTQEKGPKNIITVRTDVPWGNFCSVKSRIFLLNIIRSLGMNLASKLVCNTVNHFFWLSPECTT